MYVAMVAMPNQGLGALISIFNLPPDNCSEVTPKSIN